MIAAPTMIDSNIPEYLLSQGLSAQSNRHSRNGLAKKRRNMLAYCSQDDPHSSCETLVGAGTQQEPASIRDTERKLDYNQEHSLSDSDNDRGSVSPLDGVINELLSILKGEETHHC
ncbi:hypothetical protein FBU31_004104 [Coemansia sp. 'formosensis']|nr:hypothetical protein FBU31_004104 [Coemansia sp. 'formosensis']